MIYLTIFLTSCNYGLRPLEPITDLEELEIGTPDDEEADTDTDTDTDSDTDTDTDTDTDEDYIPTLISGISPVYGPSSGGTQLSITGGPFTGDASVTVGGYPATLLSNTGSSIRVSTPQSNVSAESEVRVDQAGGFGISPQPFYYFSDGTGLAGTIGEVGLVETVGGYWQDPAGIVDGFVSIAFSEPIDFNWWELTTSSMDSCANAASYSFNGTLYVSDMGADSISLQGSSSLTLPRGSSNSNDISYYFYQTEGLTSTQIVENSFFDLNPMTGILEGLSVSQFARASKKIVPSSPSISSSSPPSISATQTFLWSPSGASWVSIRMYQMDANGTLTSDVNCNATDDGQFTVTNLHSLWLPGDVVYIQFSRIFESNTVMSHNNSESRVVGQHVIVGAGYMN
jgi:hypothetical protein